MDTKNQRLLGKNYNRHMYYWYVVEVDGETKKLRSPKDNKRLRYADIINYYKNQGAEKVHVVREFRDYYKTFC